MHACKQMHVGMQALAGGHTVRLTHHRASRRNHLPQPATDAVAAALPLCRRCRRRDPRHRLSRTSGGRGWLGFHRRSRARGIALPQETPRSDGSGRAGRAGRTSRAAGGGWDGGGG